MEFILSFICGAYVAIVLIALIKSGKEADASLKINKAIEFIEDEIKSDYSEWRYDPCVDMLLDILKGDEN